MRTLTTADDIRIVPSDLGEHQFVGEDRDARTIAVDLAAGTMRVQAESGKPRHVFAWPVPLVPLSTLTPLLEELLPHLRAALPGCLIEPNRSGTLVAMFDADAQTHIDAASGIVGRFHLRWTGRRAASWRAAECTECGQQIYQALSTAGGLWITSTREESCRDGRWHTPYADADPRGPYHYVPGHARDLVEKDGAWTGSCGCDGWEWTDPPQSNWLDVVVGWYLHAQAIPPGAPFDD